LMLGIMPCCFRIERGTEIGDRPKKSLSSRGDNMRSFVKIILWFVLVSPMASCAAQQTEHNSSWIPIPLGEEQKTLEDVFGESFAPCVHCGPNERLLVVNAVD